MTIETLDDILRFEPALAQLLQVHLAHLQSTEAEEAGTAQRLHEFEINRTKLLLTQAEDPNDLHADHSTERIAALKARLAGLLATSGDNPAPPVVTRPPSVAVNANAATATPVIPGRG